MGIELKEVKTTSDLKRFVRFPFSLYKNNAYWVPPLIKNEMETLSREKNPAFEYCDVVLWLAYRDDRIVGRIAGIVNHKFVEKWKKKVAFFGWFDVADDLDASRALISQVETWVKAKGMTGVHGPMGLTNFDHQGMLVEGFDELAAVASAYNYSYYPKHMEALGYRKEVDYIEFEAFVPESVPEKAERICNIILKKKRLRLYKAKTKEELLPYAKPIFDVVNVTYSKLFGFVELNEKQIKMYTDKYFPFIQPEYVAIVFDENDRIIGFQITMPSLARALQKANGRLFPFGFIHLLRALKKPKYLELYLVGVIPEYQNQGVNAIFMSDLTKTAIKNKIISAETNSELETNKKVQDFWKYYNARQHKRKRIYEKIF